MIANSEADVKRAELLVFDYADRRAQIILLAGRYSIAPLGNILVETAANFFLNTQLPTAPSNPRFIFSCGMP